MSSSAGPRTAVQSIAEHDADAPIFREGEVEGADARECHERLANRIEW
jgi:hypothetical protein